MNTAVMIKLIALGEKMNIIVLLAIVQSIMAI
jgi:hypothetical protein